MPNCITGTLTEYTPSSGQPWNARRVRHLYSRLGNGANVDEVIAGVAMSTADLVDTMIDAAIAIPLEDEDIFSWAYCPVLDVTDCNTFDRQKRYSQLKIAFAAGQAKTPVRHKLALFWHSHFATETSNDGQIATFIFLYYRLLVEMSFGNFKTFVERMGLNPRMMQYLNLRDNKVGQANENYARELLELFTLGEGQYTQTDIENIARGLTGWKVYVASWDYPHKWIIQPDDKYLVSTDHDWGDITVFGENYTQTPASGNADTDRDSAYATYQWIHNKIFELKADTLAKFICRKLYKYYVYHEADEAIVNEMAEIFKTDWEITPVLRALFKSEHFFNEEAIGTQIKSPLQLYAGFVKQTGYVYNEHWYMVNGALHDDYDPAHPFDTSLTADPVLNRNAAVSIFSFAGGGGQTLFFPPSVAGWEGSRAWINEVRLVTRWEFMRQLMQYDFPYPPQAEIENSVMQLYIYIVQTLADGSTDLADVCQAIIEHYINDSLDEEHFNEAFDIFSANVEAQYIENGTWIYYEQVPVQLYNLITYLYKLPEFHMC